MKQLLLILCCFSLTTTIAQDEQETVKNTIKEFFKSFHFQDSLGMKKVVDTAIVLQTIGAQKDSIHVYKLLVLMI